MKVRTTTKLISIVAASVVVACGVVFTSQASGAVTGANPCPTQDQTTWYGDSAGTSQAVPSISSPGITYPSTVLVPADTTTYPGRRPVVVIQHGRGGDRCSLWWVAQYLAGHGFIAEVHAAPADSNQEVAFLNALDASKSAIAFMNGPANPAAAVSDMTRLGFMGHSLGSAVTSLIQGDPAQGIDAVVAFDNLRRYLEGDPGGSNTECASAPNVEVTPLVPALGMAKDEPCNITPDDTRPEIKQFGQQYWRSKGLPSMETVMRGFEHGDFSKGDTDADEAKHKDLSWYVGAWFNRWLLGDTAQEQILLSRTVNGRPTTDVLSGHYLSAACLPGRVDTSDFSSWVSADPVAPSPMAGCQQPAVPTLLSATPRPPASSTTPRISGSTNNGATVELFTTADCSGPPISTGTGTGFSSGGGIPVRVAAGSTTTFRARATNPVTGLQSACSSDAVTYRQAKAVLTGLKISAPRFVRAGSKARLRISFRNRGIAAATGVGLHIRSSNRKVKVHRRYGLGIVPARTERALSTVVRIKPSARGKARIKVTVADLHRTVALTIRPRG